MRGALSGVVAVALPILLAWARSATGSEHPLTLGEAIALALQRNEGLLIEREALAAATAAVGGARGAYDPVLELEAGWQRAAEPLNSPFSSAPLGQSAPEIESGGAGLAIRQRLPSGGALALRASGTRETSRGILSRLSPAYGTQVGVELRQPILRDLVVDAERLAVRTAVADRGGASAALRHAVSETVAAVDRAYWALVAARLSVAVREEAVRLAEEQLGETRARMESGMAPETELAQPRAELERRRGELLAARETSARAENALKLLILGDADEELWRAQIAPTENALAQPVMPDVAASLQRALTARPELAAVQAIAERRRAETAFARDGVRPTLDAVVSYDRYGLSGSRFGRSFEALGDGDFDAARVALVLGLPLRNGAAQAAAATAGHAERQADADLARVRKAIRAEVLDAAATLETAGQRIEATRAAREAAEVQLAAERDRYVTGLSTNFLVLTRQNDLSRARLEEISAQTGYRTARTEMARATGVLIEERGIHVHEASP